MERMCFVSFAKKEKDISPDMWIHMRRKKELKILVEAGRSASERSLKIRVTIPSAAAPFNNLCIVF